MALTIPTGPVQMGERIAMPWLLWFDYVTSRLNALTDSDDSASYITLTGPGLLGRAASGVGAGASIGLSTGLQFSAGDLQVEQSALTITNLSGTLTVAKGGTGAASYTVGRILYGDGANPIAASADLSFNAGTPALEIGGTQVLTERKTGWSAMTGTAARGAAATHAAQTISSPPTQAEVQAIDNSLVIVSQRLKALIDDLIAHGVIGA